MTLREMWTRRNTPLDPLVAWVLFFFGAHALGVVVLVIAALIVWWRR